MKTALCVQISDLMGNAGRLSAVYPTIPMCIVNRETRQQTSSGNLLEVTMSAVDWYDNRL